MKNYVVGLLIVLFFLFLLLSFSSWRTAYVVSEDSGVDSGVLGLFSNVSPLLIGVLIMGSVALLLKISIEDW